MEKQRKDNPFLKDVHNITDPIILRDFGVCNICGRLSFMIKKEAGKQILRCARCGKQYHEQIENPSP